MRLRDLSADQILAELEKRSDALLEAEEHVVELETRFKALESSLYRAFRNSGMSQGDAEKAVRTQENWAEQYGELQRAVVQEKDKRRAYSRCEQALQLWRTEQSTLRAIEK